MGAPGPQCASKRTSGFWNAIVALEGALSALGGDLSPPRLLASLGSHCHNATQVAGEKMMTGELAPARHIPSAATFAGNLDQIDL